MCLKNQGLYVICMKESEIKKSISKYKSKELCIMRTAILQIIQILKSHGL